MACFMNQRYDDGYLLVILAGMLVLAIHLKQKRQDAVKNVEMKAAHAHYYWFGLVFGFALLILAIFAVLAAFKRRRTEADFLERIHLLPNPDGE